jgi:ABC-type multidrug transport system ATPase subunit
MMTKVNFEETFEIYLFTKKLEGENYSKLSEFLSFLKFNKVNMPYMFSYVAKSGEGLIPDMSLNENILMNFSPNSLTASKEIQFQDFLKENSNIHLDKLYRKILHPNDLPEHSDAQMKKLTSLIKSVIFEGQFIFLEEPEHDLDSDSIELFIHVLKEHMTRNKQNVFNM